MVEFVPARKKQGVVQGIYAASGQDFITQAVAALTLTYEGIPGDIHSGFLRKSGSREPWYPRGTEMRNERQLSLLSTEELEGVARDLDIPTLMPEWIGGNVVISGIPHFSLLPARTMLFFEGGAVLRVDGYNAPCKAAGRSIAKYVGSRDDIELGFPKHAKHRRGLVAVVEREGMIAPGEGVTARIWEQCIYPG